MVELREQIVPVLDAVIKAVRWQVVKNIILIILWLMI